MIMHYNVHSNWRVIGFPALLNHGITAPTWNIHWFLEVWSTCKLPFITVVKWRSHIYWLYLSVLLQHHSSIRQVTHKQSDTNALQTWHCSRMKIIKWTRYISLDMIMTNFKPHNFFLIESIPNVKIFPNTFFFYTLHTTMGKYLNELTDLNAGTLYEWLLKSS